VLEIERVEGASLEVVATLETEILERGVPDTAEEDAVLGTASVEMALLETAVSRTELEGEVVGTDVEVELVTVELEGEFTTLEEGVETGSAVVAGGVTVGAGLVEDKTPEESLPELPQVPKPLWQPVPQWSADEPLS
jgi:hypothetical protein